MGFYERTVFLRPVPFQHTPIEVSRLVSPEKPPENSSKFSLDLKLDTILETMHSIGLERHVLSY